MNTGQPPPAEDVPPHLRDRYEQVLSEDERERYRPFVFDPESFSVDHRNRRRRYSTFRTAVTMAWFLVAKYSDPDIGLREFVDQCGPDTKIF